MIRILKYGEVDNNQIFSRCEAISSVEDIVADIIKNVKENGDKALYEYEEKFDKVKLDSLLVSKEEMEEGLKLVEPEFIEILKKAASSIKQFHVKQIREGFKIEKEDGIIIGQKITPVDRAGLYVPGGTAA